MAPLPQEHPEVSQHETYTDLIADDDIVISGISGLLPNCSSFLEFSQRLYNKENMVQRQVGRWTLRHPELSEYVGTIPGATKFDAQFFTVFSKLAHATDPMARKLFEQAYQAVYDAGVSISEIYGRKIAVYALATKCDSENLCSASPTENGLIGTSRAMFANRISYYLNLRGPSVTMDGDGVGTVVALEKAYQVMKRGDCEAAIVGSGRLTLHPQTSIMQNRTILINRDGKTKCYDANADGTSLSEAVTVMFLQKYKDAKRVYGVLKFAKTGCGAPEKQFRDTQPIPREPAMLAAFFREFYQQAGVAPGDVEYVEGNGAACPQLDKVELEAMEQVFCKDRTRPLLVGSVSSNVGFTDPSSASCSILKIIAGYSRGELAATINCSTPRQDIPALEDGRMQVLTEHAPFSCSYAAVNALSVTGVHGHVLLQGFRKTKDLSKYHSDIPYLVAISGRQESAVQKILDDLSSRPLDAEEIALLHNVYKYATTKHLARGFGIYSTEQGKTVAHCQRAEYYDDAKKPLWFVYSGMGSHWVGMGRQLMRIPVFAASMHKCHKVLEPKGVDLIHIITTEDPSIFNNILHAFVGITAFQVALTDLLAAVGLVPDKVVGHSMGELGCAYADGCFSAEQVMMLSYIRGLVSINHPMERGAMAAVGVGYKQLSKICPPEVDIACHNNSTSSTISGPYDAVQSLVDQLTCQGIFAKAVDSSDIAYHSRYIAELGKQFLKMSREVVKHPKLRSDRWVSSSVPLERWNDPEAMYSSAEYHTYNLIHPVLFEEALRYIPAHAVLVEIGPHSLLQAILKRALPSCRMAPLTRRAHPDGAMLLLEALGNLYMAGYNPDISTLYPKVEFPVSSSTRPLSHLIEWNHTENWKICRYLNPMRRFCSVYQQIVTVEDDEYQYLRGHHIEGTRVVPFATSLVAVWDTLAMALGHERRKLSVEFQEVKLHCQPPLTDRRLLKLLATVQRGSGHFEVYDGNVILVEGTITAVPQKASPAEHICEKDVTMSLGKEDIYKLLFERGYEYKEPFRNIHSMDSSMTRGLIEWQDDWVTFLDAVLQMHVLMTKHHWVSQPTAIKHMVIDVKKNLCESSSGLLEASYDAIQCRTRCGGVLTEHIAFKHKVPTKKQTIALQTLKFVPFDQPDNSDIASAISNVMQIVAENITTGKLTLLFVNVPKMQDYLDKIKKITLVVPEIDLNIITVKKEDVLDYKAMMAKPDVVFMHDLLSDKKMFEVLYHILPSDTYLISVGLDANNIYPSSIYSKVAAIGNGKTRVELARFKPSPAPSGTTAITVRSTSDLHQLRTTCELLPPQHKLLVLAPHPGPIDLKDRIKFWRKNNHKNVSMVTFDQKNAMDKELESIPDMAFSVLHEGTWGAEYYVPAKLATPPPKGVVALTCAHPGDLNSLSWVDVGDLSKQGVEVTVHYSGLVGYDASRALGEGFGSVAGGFGMDFSGVTASGDRVMGLLPRGSAASKVRADHRLLWPVPAHWTMEDAATVPFAYCYALYILSRICNPRPGMSILVHGGSGALGQALISVSLAYGLEVYATVSDMHKKHFLKKLFPELKDDHIGNSRDHTFRDMVRRGKSPDEGANIVVGCAKGALKDVAVSSCGIFGYYIDTAQLVTGENYVMGMMSLVGSRTYRTIDFSGKLTPENDFELRWMQLMLSEGIRKGYVRPLSRVTYAPHETTRAFRLLAASRHRGRVLLSVKESAPVLLPRISCLPTSSHVIVYDDEEFGLQFADLLVRRGAKKLHLHGKNTSYLNYKIENWAKLGVHVEISSANLSKKSEALSLLLHSNSLGAVDGIYVVATHPKQTVEQSAAVLANLDSTSRKICPDLRYFAVMSEDDRALREVVNERARVGLCSLSLMLPELDRFDPTGCVDDAPSARPRLPAHAAVAAAERALLSGECVVAARAQPVVVGSVLDEVAKIPGVNITKATVDRTSLESVGVDYSRAGELARLLQQRFGVTVDPETVPAMTIGRLKRFKQEPLDVSSDVCGLGAHVASVDADPMRATSDVVLMRTLVHRTKLRADEFNVTQDSLCIIPGLEGHHGRFEALCERLKLPAMVFQHGHDHLGDSLQEAARRIADSIIKYVAPKRTFYLLGYEYGVLLSLEVAAILESHGMTGTLFMFGGTPEDIQSSFYSRWRDVSEGALQDTLIRHLHRLICQADSSKLDELLRECTNWAEKVNAMIRVLQNKVTLSFEYLMGIANGIYARIRLLQEYKIHTQKLRSKIVLMQCKPHNATVEHLRSYTSQEPVLINLEASVTHAPQELKCPTIINRHLDPSILQTYNNSNQCNTVLVNDYEFLKLMVADF